MLKILTISVIILLMGAVEMEPISRRDLFEFIQLLSPIADVCIRQVNAKRADFDDIVRLRSPSSREAMCLRACITETIAVTDQNGKIQLPAIMGIAGAMLRIIPRESLESKRKLIHSLRHVLDTCIEKPTSEDKCANVQQAAACIHTEGVRNYVIENIYGIIG